MNKAIQRTNKLFKIVGYKNFFTKINNTNFLFPQNQIPKQIANLSKKFFSDDEDYNSNYKKKARSFNKFSSNKNVFK